MLIIFVYLRNKRQVSLQRILTLKRNMSDLRPALVRDSEP